MLILRPYQEQAVTEGLFDWFASNPTGNPLIAIPTGCGKSLVIAEFIRRALALYPSTRILICSHVKELVSQDHAELLELWPTAPAGIYSAGLGRRDTHLPITFVGIASIAKRVADFGHIDLCIVDEAHMISHRTGTLYHKAFDALKTVNPSLRVIGLTATPFRVGLGMLTEGDIFTDISCDHCSFEAFNKLVDDGFICPLVSSPTKTELSVEGVGIQGGEFIQHQLQAACDKDSITRAALTEAVQRLQDRNHILCFCTGVTHSNHARDILIEFGISAVCVHTDLSGGDGERDKNIALFKAGKVRCMVGVGVFSTGFNFRPIDGIIMLRPTLSPVFWVQSLGRGTRPSPETGKKNCRVLDFAKNIENLGPINDVKIPQKRGKGKGMTPFKLCPECNGYNATRARFCCDCGYEFPVTFNGSTKASTQELIRREPKEPKPPKPPKPPPPPAQVVEYEVNRVEFARHNSRDRSKPPSVRVSFVCGMHIFNEWLCFENESSFPRHKARESWRLMSNSDDEPPDTVDDALNRLGELLPPSVIRVLHNDKYPQVVGYDFKDNLIKSKHEDVFIRDESDDVPF